jgi:hypothetical protein
VVIQVSIFAARSLGIDMAGSERQRELRRRRKRTAQYAKWKKRLEKASKNEKAVIAAKLRRTTSGAEAMIKTLGISG